MISRRYSWLQKVVALAPALLLLVYLPAQVLLRCRIDGLLRAECCCSHQQQEEQSSGPAMQDQDCCAQEVAQSQRPESEAARSSSRDQAPTVAVAVIAPAAAPALAPVADRLDRAAQRHGPAREGPPLVLLKHAFLI